MDYVPFLMDRKAFHVCQLALLSDTGEKGFYFLILVWARKVKLVGVGLVEDVGKMCRVAIEVSCGTGETRGWVVLCVEGTQHGARDTRRGWDGGRAELGA